MRKWMGLAGNGRLGQVLAWLKGNGLIRFSWFWMCHPLIPRR
jgi:hypothetical protein